MPPLRCRRVPRRAGRSRRARGVHDEPSRRGDRLGANRFRAGRSRSSRPGDRTRDARTARVRTGSRGTPGSSRGRHVNPVPIAPRERTVPALLARAAEDVPAKPFLRFGTTTRSFGEVRNRVAAYAGTLAEAGVEPGDRVAIMLGNSLEFVELWL